MGEAATVSHLVLVNLATIDGPYDLIQEQMSKGQSLGIGLELSRSCRPKVRTLQYELESLSRTVDANHETLAWLVQHAAAKIN